MIVARQRRMLGLEMPPRPRKPRPREPRPEPAPKPRPRAHPARPNSATPNGPSYLVPNRLTLRNARRARSAKKSP